MIHFVHVAGIAEHPFELIEELEKEFFEEETALVVLPMRGLRELCGEEAGEGFVGEGEADAGIGGEVGGDFGDD